MEKETLEETARRILSKEGVKLHPSGLETYLKGNVINAMVEMAKWQQERMYSEEDMKESFFTGCQSERQFKPRIKCWEEWFEQFKKK
jgi:hypothetical protein